MWLQCEARVFIRESSNPAGTAELMSRFVKVKFIDNSFCSIIQGIATVIDKPAATGLAFCAEANRKPQKVLSPL